MTKTKGYLQELVNELENAHLESSSQSSCIHCWHPIVNNYCKSCDTTNNLESDPFLNLNEKVDFI